MTLPTRLVTAQDLAALPDDGRRRELVAGLVIAQPPASFRHGSVAAEVFRRLVEFVRRENLGQVVSTETGFLLARNPDTVRAPDVAFVSRSTLERAGRVRGYFPGAPDLAVEVVSPSERPADVHAKVGDYLAAGTRAVWVIDPERREVRVYRALLQPAILDEEAALGDDDLLPGFQVAVGRLFQV